MAACADERHARRPSSEAFHTRHSHGCNASAMTRWAYVCTRARHAPQHPVALLQAQAASSMQFTMSFKRKASFGRAWAHEARSAPQQNPVAAQQAERRQRPRQAWRPARHSLRHLQGGTLCPALEGTAPARPSHSAPPDPCSLHPPGYHCYAKTSQLISITSVSTGGRPHARPALS